MNRRAIYFIVNRRASAVKIGVADDPVARLATLQIGCPDRLELFAQMPGDVAYERALHNAFAEYRTHGEWFRLDGDLAQFVRSLPTFQPTPEHFSRRVSAARLARSCERELYPRLRAAVDVVGFDRFASAVQATRGDVVRAANRNGRYFPVEWFIWLLTMLPTGNAVAIADAVLAPMGLRCRRVGPCSDERIERLEKLVLSMPLGDQLLAKTYGTGQ